MEKRLLLKEYGVQLWTRELAKEVRSQLVVLLDQLEPGDTAVIDAAGVQVFDYSFANELFGKTLLSLPYEYPGRFLIVENLSPYVRLNLTKALESLGLAIIERTGGELKLLGKVHPADEATFAEVAKSREPLTAAVLRDRLGANLNAINERLTKLTNLALVRRERGVSPAGRELYLYRVLA